MPPTGIAQHPPAAGAQNQPLLDQIRLDHVFDGVPRFGQGGRQRLNADRAAGVVFGDSPQIAAVHRVQAEPVDFQPCERRIRFVTIHRVGAGDGGEIPHPAQQAPGDARGAAGAPRDLAGAGGGQVQTQLLRAAGV